MTEPMGERGRQGAAPLGGTDIEDTWVADVMQRLDERGALAPPLPPEEQAKHHSEIIRKLSQAYLASRQREARLERVVGAARDSGCHRCSRNLDLSPTAPPCLVCQPLREALGALHG